MQLRMNKLSLNGQQQLPISFIPLCISYSLTELHTSSEQWRTLPIHKVVQRVILLSPTSDQRCHQRWWLMRVHKSLYPLGLIWSSPSSTFTLTWGTLTSKFQLEDTGASGNPSIYSILLHLCSPTQFYDKGRDKKMCTSMISKVTLF